MRILTILSAIGLVLTIWLYYVGRSLPIQFTSNALVNLCPMLGMVNTLLLIFLLPRIGVLDRVSSSGGKAVFWVLVVLVLLHNFFWTTVYIDPSAYVDVEIVSIDKETPARKVIRQHADYGVFGDSFRTVQVYETPFFFRVIEKEIESD
jgi:hypothetical protein